jgi:hypothetical protein
MPYLGEDLHGRGLRRVGRSSRLRRAPTAARRRTQAPAAARLRPPGPTLQAEANSPCAAGGPTGARSGSGGSTARAVVDAVAGFGPLQPYPSVEEIWINDRLKRKVRPGWGRNETTPRPPSSVCPIAQLRAALTPALTVSGVCAPLGGWQGRCSPAAATGWLDSSVLSVAGRRERDCKRRGKDAGEDECPENESVTWHALSSESVSPRHLCTSRTAGRPWGWSMPKTWPLRTVSQDAFFPSTLRQKVAAKHPTSVLQMTAITNGSAESGLTHAGQMHHTAAFARLHC